MSDTSPTNGGGRLDRIEAALDRLEAAQERDHEQAQRDREQAQMDREERQRDFKQLMTWQVLTQDKMDAEREQSARERQRLDQLWENTDKRIADLVIAIGQFIRK